MIKDVWINLPVKDLAKSVLFYEGIGLVIGKIPQSVIVLLGAWVLEVWPTVVCGSFA